MSKIKMNKQEQIRKRTWKYFREQKWEEIKYFFRIAFRVFLAISFFFVPISQVGWLTDPETGERMGVTIAIIGLFVLGFWALIGIIELFKVIKKWLLSNWKLAKNKAKKDFY